MNKKTREIIHNSYCTKINTNKIL